MEKVVSREQAWEILKKYNKQPFHLMHGLILEGTMKYFANSLGYKDTEYWGNVGLLHDLDYEMYPDEHCVKNEELIRNEGLEKKIIKSTCSHGYGMTKTKYIPEHEMEKVLFAVDELTGLIGAVARMRPSKSVQDLELNSVKKKFKTPSFAAGCSRDTIQKGAEMLGWDLDKLISETILAMRTCEDSVNNTMKEFY